MARKRQRGEECCRIHGLKPDALNEFQLSWFDLVLQPSCRATQKDRETFGDRFGDRYVFAVCSFMLVVKNMPPLGMQDKARVAKTACS